VDDRLILKRPEWPLPLRAAWEAGIRPPVLPNDPCGAGGRWRSQTVLTTEASVGRYLQFAFGHGWPVTNEPLARLVTKSRLQAYLAHLAEVNAPATVLHRIIGLERGMAVLAPRSNRSLLRLVIADLEEYYEPASKRERLQESAALVELGFELMAAAMTSRSRSKRKIAVIFRDGLIVVFLARRPLRLRNLAMMQFGRHLELVNGIWRIRFRDHEVKNKKPIDLHFPEDLVEPLLRYQRDYWPELAGTDYQGKAVWLSTLEKQMSPVSIRQQLCAATQKAFGLPISPHLFRDCAATSLAVHAPEMVQIAHLILGNTYAVMEKHYNLARVVDAGHHIYAALGLE
jgi:integrase/recombinase XerD